MKQSLLTLLLWVSVLQGFSQLPSTRHYFSISPQGGFFDDKVVVTIDAPEGVKVYYTTNGMIPSPRQKPYSKPFRISKTTVVRALAVFPDKKRRYRAYTYFIREPESSIPVVSISVPPDILFDPEYGLYVEGPHAGGEDVFSNGANYWSKREVPVHFEFYETDGHTVFNGLVGMRLFGGISRTFPQKSFAVVARKKFGNKWIKHRVFGPKGLSRYKYLVLRNSGSDWGKSHLRDAMMTTLVEGWNVPKQDFRPVHLYLNGKYWGLYNIREKINRTYIAQHYDVDKNRVDLLEHKMTVKRGSAYEYRKFLKFLEKHDLSKDRNFARVENMMDIDNFIDYQVAEIFFNNIDAGGNIKYWREQRPGAKWRWILYDTDWGFGLKGRRDYRTNSLRDFSEKSDKSWPHPNWSTFIFRKLLENRRFRHRFINRCMDRMNSDLHPARVLSVLDSINEMMTPEIPRHLKRWHLSEKRRAYEVKKIREFAQKRPRYMRYHLRKKFKLRKSIELSITAGAGGEVVLNDVIQIKDRFTGRYFPQIPVTLRAIPEKGYRFAGWEGLPGSAVKEVKLSPGKIKTPVKAKFEPYAHPWDNRLIINEICANNYQSGDWIELYNKADKSLDLAGLKLVNGTKQFVFPKVTLPAHGYLIVCEDTAAFHQYYPRVKSPLVGNLSFGLNKRQDAIELYSSDYAFIDKFSYEMEASDVFQTLALLAPDLDNSILENWETLNGDGTPGAPNPYYVLSKINATRALYSKIGLMIGILLILLLVLYFKNSGELPAWLKVYYDRLAAKIKAFREG